MLAKKNPWKRIFNTNSELSQNRTEKQTMPSKTTINWLFNDIWHYLFIACFDWKIGFFNKQLYGFIISLNLSCYNFKGLYMSMNVPLVSKLLVKEVILLWMIDGSWFTNLSHQFEIEIAFQNLDYHLRGSHCVQCVLIRKFFRSKYRKNSVKNHAVILTCNKICSKTVPQIETRGSGW